MASLGVQQLSQFLLICCRGVFKFEQKIYLQALPAIACDTEVFYYVNLRLVFLQDSSANLDKILICSYLFRRDTGIGYF
jgi:hypothetical protein